MNATANVLRVIATKIDNGLPTPTSVTLCGRFVPPGTVQVTVDAADLTPWLTALKLDEPAWHGDNEAGLMFALWPPGTFEGKPFRLVCIKSETEVVA